MARVVSGGGSPVRCVDDGHHRCGAAARVVVTVDDVTESDGAPPLSELLRRLESALAERGVHVVQRLAPGVPQDVVREALAEIGLDPPDELLTWFAWHNGIAWRGDERLGHAYLVKWIPYSIDEAIAEYRNQPVGTEPWQWHPDWLPIAHLRNPDRLGAYCGSDTRRRGEVREVSGTERFWTDPPARTGLRELATWLTDAVEAGHWSYEVGEFAWSVEHWAEIPVARRVTGLV